MFICRFFLDRDNITLFHSDGKTLVSTRCLKIIINGLKIVRPQIKSNYIFKSLKLDGRDCTGKAYLNVQSYKLYNNK